jgi:streptogramin lyase
MQQLKTLMSRLLTVSLTLLTYFSSFAQQFNFKNYSVGEGLAQSQVYALVEDSRGYIWMGTRGGGLSRFNGTGFRNFTTREGLVNNYILCILEDESRNLWIGTNNGMSRYDGIRFENFFPAHDSSIAVSVILQEGKNKFLIGTSQGLFHFDGTTFTKVANGDLLNENVSCLYKDKKNVLWKGNNAGLSRISPDSATRLFTRKHGLSDNNVRCLTGDRRGNIWVGTYGKGLNVFDGKKFRRIDMQGELAREVVLTIYEDSKGIMWLGTQSSGVCRWNPADSSFTWLKEKDGLSNDHVISVLEDSWGNYWFGTSGGGVSKYSGQRFMHFDRSSGLPGRYVYSVEEDSRGLLWIGSSANGISTYDGTEFKRYGSDSGFKDVKVKAICEDRQGNIWIGTEGEGLSIYNGEDFRNIRGLRVDWVRDILEDRNQSIYVATAGGGISRFVFTDTLKETYSVDHFSLSEGMPQNRVNCLHEDRWGRIWFGTENNGLGYIQNDTVKVIERRHGPAGNSIRSMAEDEFGYLWVGTAGAGVSRAALYENEIHFKNLGYREGLHSTNIYLLTLDREQNLWIGTESGVDQLILDNSRNKLDIKHFAKAEGFTGIETSQNAVCRDRDGNLWFGTINGLTRYSPGYGMKNPFPPKLSVFDIRLFYEPLKNTNYAAYTGAWGQLVLPLVLPYDQNHLSFDFAGINLSNPEKVQYRWKLEGFDQDWSPVSTSNSATYSNLPPGDYVFMVKSCNEDLVWNSSPATVKFSILPPLWQNWWFILSAVVLGILLMWLGFRMRLRSVKQKAAQEKQRLQMENDLLALEQKALRLQMNPHFIFNALNSIQGLILQKDEKTARYYLAKFSKLMRMILESSRNPIISLEDEISILENYLALEKFSSEGHFDYEISIDPSISKDEYGIPPMLIQPFVENAIIHGLKHLEEKGKISVIFTRENGFLICRIIDNGIGREKARLINNSQVDQHHKSTALEVTQERLDILNPNGVKSLEIIDIQGVNGEAGGTEVLVRIPVMSFYN